MRRSRPREFTSASNRRRTENTSWCHDRHTVVSASLQRCNTGEVPRTHTSHGFASHCLHGRTTPAEEAELGMSSTCIVLVVIDGRHARGPGPAGVGAGDAGGRLHAARRHAVAPRRHDAVSDLRFPNQANDHRCRRQRRQTEQFRRRSRVHQHHRQHLAPRRLPPHARHHARERSAHARSGQQRVERQPGFPHQVRLCAVQPRRLDEQGLVGAARHPADALGRLRGGDLPLSVPGHGVRRAHPSADGDDVGGRRASHSTTTCRRTTAISTSASTTARTTSGPRSTIRRRSNFAARCGRSPPACRSCGGCGDISSTTTTTTPAATSAMRVMGNVTFEHNYLNAGFDYLSAKDQTLATATERVESGLFDLGDAAGAAGEWRVVGRTAALRPFHAQHGGDPGAGSDVASARHHGTEGSAPEPDDCRRGVLVSAPGQRQHGDPARLRRPEIRQHHDRTRPKHFRARVAQLLGGHVHESHTTSLAIAAGIASIVAVERHGAAERADQRRRRDVPEPDLLEVVRRVQQAAPERADQLPVPRLGRRHPPADQPDGVLRRHRRPDDRRAAAGGAGKDPALADRARRGGAGLQHSRRQGGAEVHRAAAGGHLPRQDHEVERSPRSPS